MFEVRFQPKQTGARSVRLSFPSEQEALACYLRWREGKAYGTLTLCQYIPGRREFKTNRKGKRYYTGRETNPSIREIASKTVGRSAAVREFTKRHKTR